jgi:general secretion pathway protein F
MREGGGLVGALGKSGLFPELSLRLISVGEQSGQLDTMLAASPTSTRQRCNASSTASRAC